MKFLVLMFSVKVLLQASGGVVVSFVYMLCSRGFALHKSHAVGSSKLHCLRPLCFKVAELYLELRLNYLRLSVPNDHIPHSLEVHATY